MNTTEPVPPIDEDDEPNNSWFARNVLWIIPLLIAVPLCFFVFVCGLPVFILLADAENHEPLKGIMETVRNSPEVQARLGAPVTSASLTPVGEMRVTGEKSVTGRFRFSVKGPKDYASVYVECDMLNDVWTHKRLDVRFRGDEVVHLGIEKTDRPMAWDVTAAATPAPTPAVAPTTP